ncbi:hypothetical protein NSQ82_04790 [Caldifermentibacillus hisashii]
MRTKIHELTKVFLKNSLDNKSQFMSLCQNAVSPEAVGSQTIKDRGFIPL